MEIVDRLIGLGSPAAALRRAIRLIDEGKAVAAVPLLARAAKAGIAEAEYRLGRCYLEGTGVPPSRAAAARWLEHGASHGHVDAQSLLAGLYLHGLAARTDHQGDTAAARLFEAEEQAQPDFDSALKWARLAAEAGSAKAQAVLGYILTVGPEPIRDLEAANGWYERAATGGSPEGSLGYALSLAKRATDAESRRQVAYYLIQAADAKLPTAIFLLAVLSEQGVGMPRDPAAAAQLYRHAAEMGVRSAQLRWGLALIAGQIVDKDPVEGESWLRRAALAGDPEAAALVGDLSIGNGQTPPNYVEAAEWYRRAAEAGHKAAARALGSLYLTGAGVARDPEEAARWLRVSAVSGDRAAQIDLANLSLQGTGAPEDLANIPKWFE